MSAELTLILGGARSGKSDLAERLAAASGRPVLFVATMAAGDDEMRARIDAHRARRPGAWRTVEASSDPLSALLREGAPATSCSWIA
jgi:adenosylcobinamide kinase/adenosylcobinamide-phosphate guanylyltransferase